MSMYCRISTARDLRRASNSLETFPLQTNSCLGLLAGHGDNPVGFLARSGDLPVGYVARHHDGEDARCERKNASDHGLPVVEKLVHSRVLYPALKRHGLSALRLSA